MAKGPGEARREVTASSPGEPDRGPFPCKGCGCVAAQLPLRAGVRGDGSGHGNQGSGDDTRHRAGQENGGWTTQDSPP